LVVAVVVAAVVMEYAVKLELGITMLMHLFSREALLSLDPPRLSAVLGLMLEANLPLESGALARLVIVRSFLMRMLGTEGFFSLSLIFSLPVGKPLAVWALTFLKNLTDWLAAIL
jgi:hypothetical protein